METELPRVTHILGKTKPKADQQRLEKSAKEYEAIHGPGTWEPRNKARCDEGTDVHKLAYDYLSSGTEPEYPTELRQYWLPFKQCLDQIGGEPAGLEMEVFNHKLRYMGHVDARLHFDDHHALIDFKTFEGYELWNGRRQNTWPLWNAKPNKPPIEERGWEHLHYRPREALVQCCMYRMALAEMGLPVDEIWVCVITKFAGCQLIQMLPQWWAPAKQEAIARINQYYSQQK